MTLYVPTISTDNVIDALGDFLQPIVGAAEIVRAQVNRVPQPPKPCVVLTELFQIDLAVPWATEEPTAGLSNIKAPTESMVQIDFYGDLASEYCKAAIALFRSQWGYAKFPANIKPLYVSDGVQSPMISGEQQWQSRWTLTAYMQYNPIITVPQDFADELIVDNIIPADV